MAIKRTKSLMPIDTGEWLDSPRINNLPYDVRGIWLTMLCYMWESPTRGIMANDNGKPYTKSQLIRLLGIDPLALESLIENGLLACDKDGAYYSPDMVHRERISNARRNAGRKGGEAMKAKILTPKVELPEQPQVTIIEPPPEQPQEPAPEAGLFSNEELSETPPELTPEQKAKVEKKKKYNYAEFVTLTRDEYAKLCEFAGGKETAKILIDILNTYKGSSGKRYKSDYFTCRGWVWREYNENRQKYDNRQYSTVAPKSAGGTQIVAGYATGAIQAPAGASPQSGDAEEKGYSERF